MSAPQYSGQPGPPSSAKGVIALVLALLSFGCPVVLSIPALILGFMAMGQAKVSGTGKGMALTAIILAFVTITVGPVVLVCGGGMFAIQKMREAATETQARAHMKNIALAVYTHESVKATLPTLSGNPGPDGRPSKLSWRVAILPYVEESKLYNQFHHDEPWDSPHNKSLLSQMPRVYSNPRYQSSSTGYADGMCYWQAFRGPGTPLGDSFPVTLTAVTDQNGASRTIMFVEAGEPVPWTKPDDITYDPNKPLPKFGGPDGGRFLIATLDGKIQKVPAGANERAIRASILYTNKDVVKPPWE